MGYCGLRVGHLFFFQGAQVPVRVEACWACQAWVALHRPHCSNFQLRSFSASTPICLRFFGHMQVATQPTLPTSALRVAGATRLLFAAHDQDHCRPWYRWIPSAAFGPLALPCVPCVSLCVSCVCVALRLLMRHTTYNTTYTLHATCYILHITC